MNPEQDKALLQAINRISEVFGPKAVLKGGMALRLQGIDRSTMDADYTFQPTKSKKEFSAELIAVMNALCDDPVTHLSDSKRLKIDGMLNGVPITIEANAYPAFEPQAISTIRLANQYELQPAIVSIMPNEMAFSNKLAAWLERRLTRDLYDIYIFASLLRVPPDPDILLQRIQKPAYARGTKPKPTLDSVAEFLAFLKSECDNLEPEQIEHDLEAILPPEQRVGLGQDILVSVRNLRLG